jgi:hypothetical protein
MARVATAGLNFQGPEHGDILAGETISQGAYAAPAFDDVVQAASNTPPMRVQQQRSFAAQVRAALLVPPCRPA